MRIVIGILIVIIVAACFIFAGYKIIQEAKRTGKYWQLYFYSIALLVLIALIIYTSL